MEKDSNEQDRGMGMRQLCARLVAQGVDLSCFDALELFARAGDWQTTEYASKVRSLEAWEIDPSFLPKLQKNIPSAQIKILDSIRELEEKSADLLPTANFIVIDNPQNCYGENSIYCEHFDVFKNLKKIIKKESIVIFNVNRKPFLYENFPNWKKRREEFYQCKNTEELSVDFLLDFYEQYFSSIDFIVKDKFSLFRESFSGIDYLYYLVFTLNPKE
jgi:hypothetical protein